MVTLWKGKEGQQAFERLFLDSWPDALTNLLRETNETNVEYFCQWQYILKMNSIKLANTLPTTTFRKTYFQTIAKLDAHRSFSEEHFTEKLTLIFLTQICPQ